MQPVLYLNSSNLPANPAFLIALAMHSSSDDGGSVSNVGMLASSTTPGISAGMSGYGACSGSRAMSSTKASCSSVQSKGSLFLSQNLMRPFCLSHFPHLSICFMMLSGMGNSVKLLRLMTAFMSMSRK